jgi:putative ABC transport system substrate-binding protein
MAAGIARRRIVAALLCAPLARPLAAQAAGRRIGFLYPGVTAASATRIAALREGLRAGGYADADRVEILVRCAEGDPARMAPLAADLVARKVDAIVAVSPAGVQAAKSATTTIPIVANGLESDPVASGFVAGLAHPGGNITGVFSDFPQFATKWLEFLKEVVPSLSRAAVLWDPGTGPVQLDAVKAAGRSLHVELTLVEIRSTAELEQGFQAAAEARPDAIVILSSPVFGTNPGRVAQLALAHHAPTITLFTEIARAGGLMAYGPNLLGAFQQSGAMLAKVLPGQRPSEIPLERPTKFEMVVNLKTAKALGLSLPAAILARADEVIE